MRISVDKLIARARELAEAGRLEDAWRVVEPLGADTASNAKLAYLWAALAGESALDDSIAATAAQIIASHPDELSLLVLAAGVLTSVAEQRPFDEAPLADGPARVAADTFAGALARLTDAERKDPEIALEIYSGLAMALRLTGRQDDDAAMKAMRQAIALDPTEATSWFKLGLLHKWRGQWAEGVRANQKARELGAEGQGVVWNLAICATGAGDYALAGAVMQEMGMKGDFNSDGMFTGGFDPVQVRVSTLGEGSDPAAHVVGEEPNFEYLWIDRLSYVHGTIVNPCMYDLPVDYGDVVLFDGAPVGYRGEGKDRVPRFPLLQKLREGAYRRYWFLSRQPHAGFLFELKSELPAGVLFYPHDEQLNRLCRTCANAGHVGDGLPRALSSVVMGKFIVPESLFGPELVARLDEVLADRTLLAIPQFYEELGDEARARRDLGRWDDLQAARSKAEPGSCGHQESPAPHKKWWQVWRAR